MHRIASPQNIIGIGLTLALLASDVLAAIPPLSDADLQQNADTIVKGAVTRIRTRQISDEPGFTDTDYYIDLQTTEVIKGNVQVGQKITVKGWQPKDRPDGWVGPQGQNEIPAAGDKVEVFCSGTIDFAFRRQGGGSETAHRLLDPNGLRVMPKLPPEFLGRWQFVRRRENETITTTLQLYPDGGYDESHRVETGQFGKSSIARGSARSGDDRVILDENRTLMMLRDGRLLLEGGHELMLFVKKPDDSLIEIPLPPGAKPVEPAISERAREFTKLIGMTVKELPNGDLKVLTVDPAGKAAQRGIRAGKTLFDWSFQKSELGSFWTTRFR